MIWSRYRTLLFLWTSGLKLRSNVPGAQSKPSPNPVHFDPPSYESSVGQQCGLGNPVTSSVEQPLQFQQPPVASAPPGYPPVTPNIGFAPPPVQTYGAPGMTAPGLGPAYPPYVVQYPPNVGYYPQMAVNPVVHTTGHTTYYNGSNAHKKRCNVICVIVCIGVFVIFVAFIIFAKKQHDDFWDDLVVCHFTQTSHFLSTLDLWIAFWKGNSVIALYTALIVNMIR